MNCDISITLNPHNTPTVCLQVNDLIIFNNILVERRKFNISTELDNCINSLKITLLNMDKGADHLLEIERIVIDGISTDRMIWEGVYSPIYPEPWASEQRMLGNVLKKSSTGFTVLGWDGNWELTFTAPVFTWIHKLENLGWIYD